MKTLLFSVLSMIAYGTYAIANAAVEAAAKHQEHVNAILSAM